MLNDTKLEKDDQNQKSSQNSNKNRDFNNLDIEVFYEQLASEIKNSFHARYQHDEELDPTKAPKADCAKEDYQLNVDPIVKTTNARFRDIIAELLAGLMAAGVLRQVEQQYRAGSKHERALDWTLTNLRWVAAGIFIAALPIILGISFILIGESWLILSKSWDFMLNALAGANDKKDLATLYGTILSMLDLMLISALVMMVTIGGYENTVSRIGLNHAYPRWFGKLDIGSLKIKVAASIATISSIHLLMNFMMIDSSGQNGFDVETIKWTAIVHGVFVLSALVLAYMNRIAHNEEHPTTHLHTEIRNPAKGSAEKTQSSDTAG
ncbi:MAG: YqhA family protein [Pseudomonadota bacterium]